ncbi:hypothetical protein ALC57_01754, partial [Trachymyrmex cornetzi]
AIPPRRGLTNVESPFEIHPSESETRVVGRGRGGAGGRNRRETWKHTSEY